MILGEQGEDQWCGAGREKIECIESERTEDSCQYWRYEENRGEDTN